MTTEERQTAEVIEDLIDEAAQAIRAEGERLRGMRAARVAGEIGPAHYRLEMATTATNLARAWERIRLYAGNLDVDAIYDAAIEEARSSP